MTELKKNQIYWIVGIIILAVLVLPKLDTGLFATYNEPSTLEEIENSLVGFDCSVDTPLNEIGCKSFKFNPGGEAIEVEGAIGALKFPSPIDFGHNIEPTKNGEVFTIETCSQLISEETSITPNSFSESTIIQMFGKNIYKTEEDEGTFYSFCNEQDNMLISLNEGMLDWYLETFYEDTPSCTQEVKQCSDGSYVGSDQENGCAFKPCPDEFGCWIPKDADSCVSAIFFVAPDECLTKTECEAGLPDEPIVDDCLFTLGGTEDSEGFCIKLWMILLTLGGIGLIYISTKK